MPQAQLQDLATEPSRLRRILDEILGPGVGPGGQDLSQAAPQDLPQGIPQAAPQSAPQAAPQGLPQAAPQAAPRPRRQGREASLASGSPLIGQLVEGILGPRPEVSTGLGKIAKSALAGFFGGPKVGIDAAHKFTGVTARKQYDDTANTLADYIVKRVPLIKKDYVAPDGAVPTDRDAYEILGGELGLGPYQGPFTTDTSERRHTEAQATALDMQNLDRRVADVLSAGVIPDLARFQKEEPEVAALVVPIAKRRGGKVDNKGSLTFRTPDEHKEYLRAQRNQGSGSILAEKRYNDQQARYRLGDFNDLMKRKNNAIRDLAGSSLDQMLAKIADIQAAGVDPKTGMPSKMALEVLRNQTHEQRFRLHSNISAITQIVNPPELQKLVAGFSDGTQGALYQAIYDFNVKRYPLAAQSELHRDQLRKLTDDYFTLADYLIKLKDLEDRLGGK